MPKEWNPTLKKVECTLCKLELVCKKDSIVVHFGHKTNDSKMQRWHSFNVKGRLSKFYLPSAMLCGL